MALTTSKISSGPMVTNGTSITKVNGINYLCFKSVHELHGQTQGLELRQQSNGYLMAMKLKFFDAGSWHLCGKPGSYNVPRGSSMICQSTRMRNTDAKDCIERAQGVDEDDEHNITSERTTHSILGLAEACKFVYNDAKFVNERARNDIVLLSRGIMSLDARARQDVAILGSEFLKLDARAREDTEKIDHNVKRKAERLHHIAIILRDIAQSGLKSAADQHWSDGALEADLRRADILAKQRAMEDALMALEFVKNIHDRMVSKMYKFPLRRTKGSLQANGMLGHITIERNGKTHDFFPGEVSADRITAIQEAYWSMAAALSEADGIDYTDPEELELLVTTLIDLDAMDGKSSVSLLVECSNSPDVNTRKALAKALAAAPSMWTLGNAGMGALQRLAEDSNPAIALAASNTIHELKKQWEIEEGDSWRFMMNDQKPLDGVDSEGTDGDAVTE